MESLERTNLGKHPHSFHRPETAEQTEANNLSCIFAPPEPNSVIGNTEEIEVAWCVRESLVIYLWLGTY